MTLMINKDVPYYTVYYKRIDWNVQPSIKSGENKKNKSYFILYIEHFRNDWTYWLGSFLMRLLVRPQLPMFQDLQSYFLLNLSMLLYLTLLSSLGRTMRKLLSLLRQKKQNCSSIQPNLMEMQMGSFRHRLRHPTRTNCTKLNRKEIKRFIKWKNVLPPFRRI